MCSVRFTLTTQSRKAVARQLKTAQQPGPLTPGQVLPRPPRRRERPEFGRGRRGLARA